MTENSKGLPTWKFQNLRFGREMQGVLRAYWEVALDPISDNYTPAEISAYELLEQWAKRVKEEYPDGLIPIYWSVECSECGVFERMPFQFKHSTYRDENFLTFFSYPVEPATNERLNWLALPIADKLWNSD